MAFAENATSSGRCRVRRWLPLLLALALTPLVGACRSPRPDAEAGGDASPTAAKQRLAEDRARMERQRQVERCLRERPELEARMAALRRAEHRLAQARADSYIPSPPPAPWDEELEARFRLEDREADRQRHLQERESWRQREENRRARWRAQQRERLRIAQWRLNQEAEGLRSRRADLFTGPGSIEFNPMVEAEIRHCGALSGRPIGKTAPP
ncbi:MAG: hypothetical protein VKO39_00460 [Cyanobacteriota bacterium]|nr:hypothetical protein [Cyanobacteriota bacterium]